MNTKIKFNISKVLFPKDGKLNLGDYSIISCNLVKQLEGEPIILDKKYHNFCLVSSTPVEFNSYDIYEAEVKKIENKYGISYKLINLILEENKELSEGAKRSFLEMTLTSSQIEALYSLYPNPYDLIKNKDTEKLLKVKGIGELSIKHLYNKYDENLKYEKLIIELQDYGLTKSIMENLLLTYGSAEVAIKKVKENVYILADELKGIGFKKADALALKSGIAPNSINRLKAFLCYFLNIKAEEGNSWLKPSMLFGQIEAFLGTKFEDNIIRQAIYELNEEGILFWNKDKTKIYLEKFYSLEKNIFLNIERIKNSKIEFKVEDEIKNSIISVTEKEYGFGLTLEQKQALDIILNNNFSLLVGYAGTGKTSLIKLITRIFESKKLNIKLCSLSGKASARIQESTGYEGSTIHRTLGYIPNQGFTFNENNLLPYDIIIVDESSFVGGELFLSLIKAIKTGAKLILVGDDKQLPAIGMCNIFYDLINSHKVPIGKLTQIHRQAQKSGIITTSKLVREGQQIVKNGWIGTEVKGELKDLTLDVYSNKLFANPKIMEWYKKYVNTLEDSFHTQIIVPMKYRGEFNTFDLNNQIQSWLNPESSVKKQVLISKNGKNYYLRVGDKVINRKNDYEAKVFSNEGKTKFTEIFNGFCGQIKDIKNNEIIVKFDLCKEEIAFSYDKRNNLELAYALTVHLYQGSQVENVIFGIDNGSFIMNTKELLYTAITRASKNCVIVSEAGTLRKCCLTSQTNNKQTFLQEFLINKNA